MRGSWWTGQARTLAAIAVLAGAALGGCAEPGDARAVEALEVVDVQAYWAVRGRFGDQNYVYPVVRFRVRNGGDRPVAYVQALTVFRRKSEPDIVWTSAYEYSIAGQPIEPGGTSRLVTLRADTNYVSSDPPERMLENPEWDSATVEIFLKVGSSDWRSVARVDVADRIGAPGVDKFLRPMGETDEGGA